MSTSRLPHQRPPPRRLEFIPFTIEAAGGYQALSDFLHERYAKGEFSLGWICVDCSEGKGNPYDPLVPTHSDRPERCDRCGGENFDRFFSARRLEQHYYGPIMETLDGVIALDGDGGIAALASGWEKPLSEVEADGLLRTPGRYWLERMLRRHLGDADRGSFPTFYVDMMVVARHVRTGRFGPRKMVIESSAALRNVLGIEHNRATKWVRDHLGEFVAGELYIAFARRVGQRYPVLSSRTLIGSRVERAMRLGGYLPYANAGWAGQEKRYWLRVARKPVEISP